MGFDEKPGKPLARLCTAAKCVCTKCGSSLLTDDILARMQRAYAARLRSCGIDPTTGRIIHRPDRA